MQFRRSCCDLVLVEEATEPVTPTNRAEVMSTKKIVSWLVMRGPKPEHVDTVLVDRHIVEYNEGEFNV